MDAYLYWYTSQNFNYIVTLNKLTCQSSSPYYTSRNLSHPKNTRCCYCFSGWADKYRFQLAQDQVSSGPDPNYIWSRLGPIQAKTEAGPRPAPGPVKTKAKSQPQNKCSHSWGPFQDRSMPKFWIFLGNLEAKFWTVFEIVWGTITSNTIWFKT